MDIEVYGLSHTQLYGRDIRKTTQFVSCKKQRNLRDKLKPRFLQWIFPSSVGRIRRRPPALRPRGGRARGGRETMVDASRKHGEQKRKLRVDAHYTTRPQLTCVCVRILSFLYVLLSPHAVHHRPRTPVFFLARSPPAGDFPRPRAPLRPGVGDLFRAPPALRKLSAVVPAVTPALPRLIRGDGDNGSCRRRTAKGLGGAGVG